MKHNQTVRYLTTDDQVRLAWSSCGSGPSLVKASNWITDLEYDWASPVWRHWMEFLCSHFELVRADERGCGLSQREVEDTSTGRWLKDLECLVDAAQPTKPFALLGISQGSVACIEYAVKYPERVSHMVLYGGYARGWTLRSDPDHVREGRALLDFTELGWGRSDPLYRRLFTKRFLPEGSEEQLLWFDEMCAHSVSPEMAARLLLSRGKANVTESLAKVSVPTLVVHAREDRISPLRQGQALAAGIPGAEFVQLDSPNHILMEDEPAWERFKEVVLAFTGRSSNEEAEVFATLSAREREVLQSLLSGMTNAAIGEALFISEKTVRNQLTRIFSKLGVSNRTEAIVLAKDGGFGLSSE